MKILLQRIFLPVFLVAFTATSSTYASFDSQCSTTEKIYFSEDLKAPDGLDKEAKREAVMAVLSHSGVDPSWAKNSFKGQWYYEYQAADVVYAGLTIRSHYLQLAINIVPDGLTTIVCDSDNLRQKKRSTHRKVPLWKGKFDSNLRIALGKAGEAARSQNTDRAESEVVSKIPNNNFSSELLKISELYEAGLLTDEEFGELKQRLIARK